jgi:hypothetical protein
MSSSKWFWAAAAFASVLAASSGALVGLLAGVVNLVLATVAGLVTGWFSMPSPSRSLKEMVG